MRLAISRRWSRSAAVKAGLFVSTLTLASLAMAGVANAIIFDNRIAFEATLGILITDDYSSPGYAAGDVTNAANFDIHTDANMSAIFGETRYTSTILPIPFTNRNFVRQTSGDAYYCGDCNASYRLDFTATSIGTANGVFGVGFDVRIVAENIQAGDTAAFVTFGDGTIESFAIPGQPDFTTDQFWGITDSRLITSIAFDRPEGRPARFPRMGHDNLTIGTQAQVLPEPSVILLFGLGLAGLGFAVRRARPGAAAVVRPAASRCPGRRGFPR